MCSNRSRRRARPLRGPGTPKAGTPKAGTPKAGTPKAGT
ncbi:antitoxin, partial [Streptomyces sp. ICN441]